MRKKLLTLIIILTMTLGIVPADIAMADDPDPVYYTIHFDNYEALNEAPLSTGERPYDGMVHKR